MENIMKQQSLILSQTDESQKELTVEQKIKIRATANQWISSNFPKHRKYLSHSTPQFSAADRAWETTVLTQNLNGHSQHLGRLLFNSNAEILLADHPANIRHELQSLLNQRAPSPEYDEALIGRNYEFRLGDGIAGAQLIHDYSIDLLLTDPPYGISKEYTCERQVPRRLRKNGTDFIMPKGNFGEWDAPISPGEWTEQILPKVRGWFVTFCAQAQIGEYCKILEQHKFVAVGTLVWQKTNPVPFNHKYKPINAWEAIVIGKRPGTKFNGHVVHNVFVCKSPSPQQRIHTTQKPLPLIKEFIELFSDKGDFVYDPFAGSATTLIAAMEMRRKVIAYEKDRAIYESACGRILSAAG